MSNDIDLLGSDVELYNQALYVVSIVPQKDSLSAIKVACDESFRWAWMESKPRHFDRQAMQAYSAEVSQRTKVRYVYDQDETFG